jgi:hypothetical protein
LSLSCLVVVVEGGGGEEVVVVVIEVVEVVEVVVEKQYKYPFNKQHENHPFTLRDDHPHHYLALS